MSSGVWGTLVSPGRAFQEGIGGGKAWSARGKLSLIGGCAEGVGLWCGIGVGSDGGS